MSTIDEAYAAAVSHVRDLIVALGEDPAREGLRGTPDRVVRMFRELMVSQPFEFTTFESGGMSEMIVQCPIPFASLCEHHMLPFVGRAAIAYVPSDRIVGLSKLARAVQHCSKGLRNQEGITVAVADLLEGELHPQGVGVVLRARHLCMELRGPRTPDVWTTTSCLRGALFEDGKSRAEFLRLAAMP